MPKSSAPRNTQPSLKSRTSREFSVASPVRDAIFARVLYDAFISYASEDRHGFVRPLAEALKRARVEVWYDEFSLKAGDSLRSSIDKGLAKSRFGIVVLSPNFFRKRWPTWELDGLVQRQNAGKQQVLIPIWHQLGHAEVVAESPSLGNIVSLNSAAGVDQVVKGILKTVQPEGSTLIIARDFMLSKGAEPPVVTDDWWLDVLENSNYLELDPRWRFNLWSILPEDTPRGVRLGWLALEEVWNSAAQEQRITQITPPEEVLAFIASQPGLDELIMMSPEHLLHQAPQLAIPGFGGKFEPLFDAMLAKSVREAEIRQARNDRHGSAITTNGKTPGCDDSLALRHPTFGNYDSSVLACDFVQGVSPMGSGIKAYEAIDYLAWFLSDASNWLPPASKKMLTQGMIDWAVWLWYTGQAGKNDVFVPNDDTGNLFRCMDEGLSARKFRLTAGAKRDLLHRLDAARILLNLPEPATELFRRFQKQKVIEGWYSSQLKRSSKRKKAVRQIKRVG